MLGNSLEVSPVPKGSVHCIRSIKLGSNPPFETWQVRKSVESHGHPHTLQMRLVIPKLTTSLVHTCCLYMLNHLGAGLNTGFSSLAVHVWTSGGYDRTSVIPRPGPHFARGCGQRQRVFGCHWPCGVSRDTGSAPRHRNLMGMGEACERRTEER